MKMVYPVWCAGQSSNGKSAQYFLEYSVTIGNLIPLKTYSHRGERQPPAILIQVKLKHVKIKNLMLSFVMNMVYSRYPVTRIIME
jgi:hypothetical protein